MESLSTISVEGSIRMILRCQLQAPTGTAGRRGASARERLHLIVVASSLRAELAALQAVEVMLGLVDCCLRLFDFSFYLCQVSLCLSFVCLCCGQCRLCLVDIGTGGPVVPFWFVRLRSPHWQRSLPTTSPSNPASSMPTPRSPPPPACTATTASSTPRSEYARHRSLTSERLRRPSLSRTAIETRWSPSRAPDTLPRH